MVLLTIKLENEKFYVDNSLSFVKTTILFHLFWYFLHKFKIYVLQYCCQFFVNWIHFPSRYNKGRRQGISATNNLSSALTGNVIGYQIEILCRVTAKVRRSLLCSLVWFLIRLSDQETVTLNNIGISNMSFNKIITPNFS